MRSRHRASVALLVCLAVTIAGGAAAAAGGAATAERATAGQTPALEAGPLDAPAQSSITVESVTVDQSTVTVGETVTVEARVVNNGNEPTSYDATLAVGGEAVETKSVGSVEPGFPVIVPFEYTFEEAGTYAVSVGGTSTEVTVEGTDTDSGSSDEGDQSGDGTDQAANPGQFEVRNVTVSPATAGVGETVAVGFEVDNQGDERADFEVQLEVDGEVVATKTVEAVGPEIPVPDEFEYSFNETGSYTVSVSGVEAGQQVTVEEQSGGGGGGLFGFLGFLPLGLLRPLVLFIVLPLLLVYLALKALAIYLGY